LYATKQELIQFNIVNQTDCSFNLPLFQQNVYSVNATTKYTWDITTADLSCGTGTIVVNGNTMSLVFAANLAGLLAALNALGFGFFCSETSGGSTYFYTVDESIHSWTLPPADGVGNVNPEPSRVHLLTTPLLIVENPCVAIQSYIFPVMFPIKEL